MFTNKPLMPIYLRILHAPTAWLMSNEGRIMIAKSLRLARNKHGKAIGREMHNALICAGCIYPLLRNVA